MPDWSSRPRAIAKLIALDRYDPGERWSHLVGVMRAPKCPLEKVERLQRLIDRIERREREIADLDAQIAYLTGQAAAPPRPPLDHIGRY